MKYCVLLFAIFRGSKAWHRTLPSLTFRTFAGRRLLVASARRNAGLGLNIAVKLRDLRVTPAISSSDIVGSVDNGAGVELEKLPKLLSSTAIAEVVNWAYRGKTSGPGAEPIEAWTTERHLISGTRTSPNEIDEIFANCQRLGRNQEQFLVASRSQENEIGNSLAAFRAKQAHLEWDSPTVMGPAALREAASTRDAILSKCSDESNRLLVGTVHVKCHDGSNEAEIGMLAVDPDEQGLGAGAMLLEAAETHARDEMGANIAVLWVISVRSELLTWYYSRRYRGTGITQPFPAVPGAIFGQPKEELNFVRLEKDLLP